MTKTFKKSGKSFKNNVESWGATSPKILFVGFCAHSSDLVFQKALYSRGGQMLRAFASQAGIDLDECRYSVIVPFAPMLDKTENLLVPAKGVPADLKPWLKVGTKYLSPELFKHVAAIQAEIKALKPNLIVTLGAEACSLLTGEHSHSSVRGTVLPCSLDPEVKVLPVFHPTRLFMQVSSQVIFKADLKKIVKESRFAGIKRVRREITIPETFEECQDWWKANKAKKVTVDIETVPSYKVITCIGFATSEDKALTIPLYSKDSENGSYWSPSEEVYVWGFIKGILESPEYELVFQGGAYDIQWLYQIASIKSINYLHDTMLLHHSLFPEMQKGLGFLASIYTTEPSWKGMVNFKNESGAKADG